MYEPRIYRQQFNSKRFHFFQVFFRETDLWIGVDQDSYNPDIKNIAFKKVVSLRNVLDEFIRTNPDFRTSLLPLKTGNDAPPEAKEMAEQSARAGVGPMAAVAGFFSQEVAAEMIKKFDPKELVIENGGDIFLQLSEDLTMSVYAGKSPLSEKIGVVIPAKESSLGVCTSAGTVGPSLSFGKADAVMVACKNTALADAWATALGNRVKSAADIEPTLAYSEKYPEILSLVIICEGKVGIKGSFEVKMLK
jgi:uncharacterized protein